MSTAGRRIAAALAAGVALAVGVGVATVVTDEPSGFPLTPATVPPPETQAPLPAASIVLRGDGLGIASFGEAGETVVGRFRELLGVPNEDEPGRPCDGTPRRWVRWADLSVVLERSRFVAYTSGIYYPPGPAAFGVTTAEGLRAGDPVAKLRRAYGDAEITKPPPSGFEGERWIFTAATQGGDVTGVIEGDRTNGRVVAITAGSHCNTGG